MAGPALVYLLAYLAFAFTLWAPISAIRRPRDRYRKGSKALWVWLLLVGLILQGAAIVAFDFPLPLGFVLACLYALLVVRNPRATSNP
jgi:heme A synthase